MVRHKTVGFRPSDQLQKYIDHQLKLHPTKSAGVIAKELAEKALSNSGQKREAPPPPSIPHVERGKDIDTHHQVKRGDHILIPCPTINKWVDKDLDCSGCHLKCPLPTDLLRHFEGLAYYTTP